MYKYRNENVNDLWVSRKFFLRSSVISSRVVDWAISGSEMKIDRVDVVGVPSRYINEIRLFLVPALSTFATSTPT